MYLRKPLLLLYGIIPLVAVWIYWVAPESIAQDREVYLKLTSSDLSSRILNSASYLEDRLFWEIVNHLSLYTGSPKFVIPLFAILPYLVFAARNIRIRQIWPFLLFFLLDRFVLAGLLNTTRSFTALGYFIFFIWDKNLKLRILGLVLSGLFHFKVTIVALLLLIISKLLQRVFNSLSVIRLFETRRVRILLNFGFIVLVALKFIGWYSFNIPYVNQIEEAMVYNSIGSVMNGNIRILFPLVLFLVPIILTNRISLSIYLFLSLLLLLYPEIVFIARLFPLFIIWSYDKISLKNIYTIGAVKLMYFFIFWYV